MNMGFMIMTWRVVLHLLHSVINLQLETVGCAVKHMPSQMCSQTCALACAVKRMPYQMCSQTYALSNVQSIICPLKYAVKHMPSQMCSQTYALSNVLH